MLPTTDDVWWNVPQPGPGCQVIVMSPVGQHVAGTNCGNVVMAQKSAGCFYTHLGDTFMTQYCCGEGDCSKAGIGGTKRSISSIASQNAGCSWRSRVCGSDTPWPATQTRFDLLAP